MMPNQGLADEVHVAQADAVMHLTENVRPEDGSTTKSGDLLGGLWLPGATTSSSFSGKAPQLPIHGNAQSMSKGGDGTFQREALTPVDGSPTAGFEFPTTPSFHIGVGGLAATSLRLKSWDRRRKRSADMGVFVDEEFRGDSSGLRNTDERARARQAVEAPGSASASSGSRFSPVQAAFPSMPLSVAPAPSHTEAEVDVEMEDIVEDNTENEPPRGLPLPPINPGALGAAMERLVLKDLVLEVPPELQEHPESDVESSSGHSTAGSEGEEDSNAEPRLRKNLADMLAERIQNNVDGRYDFEIFCDPE
jgi:hypothetical protein